MARGGSIDILHSNSQALEEMRNRAGPRRRAVGENFLPADGAEDPEPRRLPWPGLGSGGFEPPGAVCRRGGTESQRSTDSPVGRRTPRQPPAGRSERFLSPPRLVRAGVGRTSRGGPSDRGTTAIGRWARPLCKEPHAEARQEVSAFSCEGSPALSALARERCLRGTPPPAGCVFRAEKKCSRPLACGMPPYSARPKTSGGRGFSDFGGTPFLPGAAITTSTRGTATAAVGTPPASLLPWARHVHRQGTIMKLGAVEQADCLLRFGLGLHLNEGKPL